MMKDIKMGCILQTVQDNDFKHRGDTNKMRVKIKLDTVTDIANFVLQTNKVKDKVYITDTCEDFKVDAKSFLGLCYATKEFEDMWCLCDKDIYALIREYVI